MFAALLAASLSFSASATGVEKGTAVEFVFAGSGTDRDYETMFVLDETPDALCSRLEKAGLPRGVPVDLSKSILWPAGCRLSFDPPISKYVVGKMPAGLAESDPIYTGGTRLKDGRCEAGANMPLSFFSFYTLAQSPIVLNGIYNQGDVYGAFTAAQKMEKGTKVKFTVSWDPGTLPKFLSLTAKPGEAVQLVKTLRQAATNRSELVVRLGFDERLTVTEATAVANAVATLDSCKIKFNGTPDFFYRSFLPLVKWRERKERLIQPFELTIGESDELLHIIEDWSVEGCDPALSAQKISFTETIKFPKTDTCFVFAAGETKLARIRQSLDKLPASAKKNVYVFVK